MNNHLADNEEKQALSTVSHMEILHDLLDFFEKLVFIN